MKKKKKHILNEEPIMAPAWTKATHGKQSARFFTGLTFIIILAMANIRSIPFRPAHCDQALEFGMRR